MIKYENYIKEHKFKNKVLDEKNDLSHLDTYVRTVKEDDFEKTLEVQFLEFKNTLKDKEFQLNYLKKLFNSEWYEVPIRPEGITSWKHQMERGCHLNSQLMASIIGGKKVMGYGFNERTHHQKSDKQRAHFSCHSVWLTPEGKMIEVTPYPYERHIKRTNTIFLPLFILEKDEMVGFPNVDFSKGEIKISKKLKVSLNTSKETVSMNLDGYKDYMKNPEYENCSWPLPEVKSCRNFDTKSLLSEKTLKDFIDEKGFKIVEDYSPTTNENKVPFEDSIYVKLRDKMKSNSKMAEFEKKYFLPLIEEVKKQEQKGFTELIESQ